jgi:predicted lipoprotein with Yx(FWY)xxD motif
MTKIALGALLAAATLFLAACGDGGDESQATSFDDSGTTVSVKSVDPVGDVLVDSAGKTLYTSDVEAKGKILCTGACASFWKPLEPGTDAPSATGDAGKLATVGRPDGTMQVTANGHPLYTFAEDGRGEAKGDGFSDDFAGRHFVWHAVAAGGTIRPSGGSGSGGSPGGYSSGGGY